MKHLVYLIGLLFWFKSTFSQTTQWATKLLGYSSEYVSPATPGSYSAKQILGKPNRFPVFGPTANAWSPLKEDAELEWIHVGYDQPMAIQQVVVAENNGAGCLIKVEAIDETGSSHVLYENASPVLPSVNGRWWYLFTPLTNYKVSSLKLTLNTSLVKGYNHLDAVAISNQKDSVKLNINLVKGWEVATEREDLGAAINSSTDELLPVISPDGKTLLFTRQGHPENIAPVGNQDIWFSQMDENGKFSTVKNLGGPINNYENNAALCLTPDGQKLLVMNVYKPDGTMDKGMSISVKKGEVWQLPEKVEMTNFYNDNLYGEYILSVSGKVMIMTLQRKDGQGSKDLHVSFLQENGVWSEPKNMGTVLNTAESEATPFLAADEKTLYFSTSGWPGYGKNDVFVTHRLDDTWLNWSEPENLGPNLNTAGWDAYYAFTADGKYVYYVSSVDGRATDIFRKPAPVGAKPLPVVVVKGKVLDSKTKQPLASNITYEFLKQNKNAGFALSNAATGEYSIILSGGEQYSFLASSDNYYSISENLDLTKLKEYAEVKKDLYLAPIEKGITVRLNNLFFDFNKSNLKPESVGELNRLIDLLIKHPNMKIEISGHTDDVGTQEFNLPLSNKRAASVLQYLVQNGIEQSRLISKGYGKTKPVAKGIDEESRRLNRRVEFIILEM